MLIPAFKAAGAQFHTIATAGGINGVIHGQKAGFAEASTDVDAMLANPTINTVAVVTRHDSHARFVSQVLRAGKSVFVEKPLAIHAGELQEVRDAYQAANSNGASAQLMVGFNRRFSPQVQKMKSLLAAVKEPKSFIMTMNAGAIPANHWTQDKAVGGGRIIGEACHFIDLMRFLAGSRIVSVQARSMGDGAGVEVTEDKASITLGFEDGSFGTILYLANGAASFLRSGSKYSRLDECCSWITSASSRDMAGQAFPSSICGNRTKGRMPVPRHFSTDSRADSRRYPPRRSSRWRTLPSRSQSCCVTNEFVHGKGQDGVGARCPNLLRVLAYRMGVMTGLNPVRRLQERAPSGDFFLPTPPRPSVVSWLDKTPWLGRYFGYVPYAADSVPDWHSNLLTGMGMTNSDRNWWEIPISIWRWEHIKAVWEASRFDWVPALAQKLWLVRWCAGQTECLVERLVHE